MAARQRNGDLQVFWDGARKLATYITGAVDSWTDAAWRLPFVLSIATDSSGLFLTPNACYRHQSQRIHKSAGTADRSACGLKSAAVREKPIFRLTAATKSSVCFRNVVHSVRNLARNRELLTDRGFMNPPTSDSNAKYHRCHSNRCRYCCCSTWHKQPLRRTSTETDRQATTEVQTLTQVTGPDRLDLNKCSTNAASVRPNVSEKIDLTIRIYNLHLWKL